MAAAVDDDDSWLYSHDKDDENKEQVAEENNAEEKEADGEETKKPENGTEDVGDDSQEKDKEAGELSGEEQEGAADEDSDSDDDVQVTIKDISSAPPAYGAYGSAPVNLNLAKRTPYVATGVSTQPSNISVGGKAKGLDIDSVGSINGVPSYDFNLDTVEDKPWLKPGADITDYFNYGFQEETWKIYCERQRKLRLENTNSTGLISVKTGDTATAVSNINENSKYQGMMPADPMNFQKQMVQPIRKVSGSINVIGGDVASRRMSSSPPKESPIQVMTGIAPGMTTMPPPNYMGPPNLNMPPPGMMPRLPVPPQNMGLPPPNFADPYGYNRFPPPNHMGMTPKGDDDRKFDYQDRESRRDYGRRDTSPSRRDSYRDSGRDRARDRDSGRLSPDDYESRRHRDRDRDYDRRERDRERRHRDREREDRHRSKRKHHRDDEEGHEHDREDDGDKHRSSRHKRKRSKRDKDGEEGDSGSRDATDAAPSETASSPPAQAEDDQE